MDLDPPETKPKIEELLQPAPELKPASRLKPEPAPEPWTNGTDHGPIKDEIKDELDLTAVPEEPAEGTGTAAKYVCKEVPKEYPNLPRSKVRLVSEPTQV